MRVIFRKNIGINSLLTSEQVVTGREVGNDHGVLAMSEDQAVDSPRVRESILENLHPDITAAI